MLFDIFQNCRGSPSRTTCYSRSSGKKLLQTWDSVEVARFGNTNTSFQMQVFPCPKKVSNSHLGLNKDVQILTYLSSERYFGILELSQMRHAILNIRLTLPITCISENLNEIKIKLNFYLHNSLWCHKRFYEGLFRLGLGREGVIANYQQLTMKVSTTLTISSITLKLVIKMG